MSVTKKRTVVMPQLAEPVKRRFGRVPSTVILATLGICGTIVFVALGIYNPSVVTICAALAAFFAAFTSTAIFKSQETEAEILTYKRKMLGPLVRRSKALLESKDVSIEDFRTRFALFEQLEDSENFAFLSDELQGTYIDCVEEGRKYGKVLSGESTVTAIPNDFGITGESIGKDTIFAPFGRLLRMLIDDCTREAKVSKPMRTLRSVEIRSRKIGRLVLYKTIEEAS